MAYEPTNWKAGDVVTSAKLNKMEQGIVSGANILIAHATQEEVDIDSIGKTGPTVVVKLDKTAREILDADFTIIIHDASTSEEGGLYRDFLVISVIEEPNSEAGYSFKVVSLFGEDESDFHAATEEDYPELTST